MKSGLVYGKERERKGKCNSRGNGTVHVLHPFYQLYGPNSVLCKSKAVDISSQEPFIIFF